MAALLIVNQDRRRKQRKFRQRVSNLDEFSDQEVIARYRLDKATINELEELCRTDLSPKTYRSSSVKSMTKVLVGLRFLAKGDFLSEVADLHGISKARAATALDEFVRSVNVKLRNISFPTDRQSQTKLKRQFYEKCRIPNILGIDLQFLSPGAVDGTLIPIICPSENEAAFVCRKGYHALNVQAVCDTSMRFTDAVAMWPGSQHDSAIFNVCGLKDYLEGSQAGMLLGDSGYPLRRYLLTPKTNPSTPQEELFNNQHTKGRLAIERAFGLLKSRFRCLHKTGGLLHFSPGKCSHVIMACMRLHNLCIDRGVQEPAQLVRPDDDDDIPPYINTQLGAENRNIRQEIINLF